MTETESENWTGRNRLHYLTIAVVSLGQAAIMLDLQLARPFAMIATIAIVAWVLDIGAELYSTYR